jgi:hypothetical protein
VNAFFGPTSSITESRLEQISLLAPPGASSRTPSMAVARRTSRSFVLASLRALHLDLRLLTYVTDSGAAWQRI